MANVNVLITEYEISKRCRELGEQISQDYKGKTVHLICVLTGAIYFACELSKYISVPVVFDCISASSYGNKKTSSGVVNVLDMLKNDIKGKDVLIVEDIIDTGNTIKKLEEILNEKKPRSIKVCTMLDKPESRKVNVKADYVAFNLPDKFVVGYGLDNTDGTCRNLPYIGYIE